MYPFFEIHMACFLTTSLTIVRCELRGDSSTREHENARFGWQNSTKKHYLALEKLKNRSWGGRGRKFKSCHSDQKRQNKPCVCSAFSYLNFTMPNFANAIAFARFALS